jgi:hypothetical protein
MKLIFNELIDRKEVTKMKTLKERLNEMTLKELISETKKFNTNYGYNTKISVYITSVGNDSKRHTVVVDPDSNRFMDTTAMIAFEDCTVSEFKSFNISAKDYLLIIIVDLDKHYENATFDKWWRK